MVSTRVSDFPTPLLTRYLAVYSVYHHSEPWQDEVRFIQLVIGKTLAAVLTNKLRPCMHGIVVHSHSDTLLFRNSMMWYRSRYGIVRSSVVNSHRIQVDSYLQLLRIV